MAHPHGNRERTDQARRVLNGAGYRVGGHLKAGKDTKASHRAGGGRNKTEDELLKALPLGLASGSLKGLLGLKNGGMANGGKPKGRADRHGRNALSTAGKTAGPKFTGYSDMAKGGKAKAHKSKAAPKVKISIVQPRQAGPAPVPVPMPQGPARGMGTGLGGAPPMPPQAGPPPGGMPMGLPKPPGMKRGGKADRYANGGKIKYPHMEGGAGGALGRLEKAKDYGTAKKKRA